MKKKVSVVWICITLLFAAGTVFARGVEEQKGEKFPTRPIRFILPVAPGGGMEISIRQLQPFVEAELGVPLSIENQAGAGTLIGNRAVATAVPDGYTIGMFSSTDFEFTILTKDAPYTLKSFDFLILHHIDACVIRVHKDSPWNNLTEFLNYVRSQPKGSVAVSVPTSTGVNALGFKLIEDAANVKFNIVNYTGGNPARLALAKKEVLATHSNLYNSLMIADTTKVISVHYNENRWGKLADNAKTVSQELGVKVPDTAGYYGIYAPAGLTEKYPDRAKKIVDAFLTALNNPKYIASLEEIGEKDKVLRGGPEEAKKFIEDSMKMLEQYKHYFK